MAEISKKFGEIGCVLTLGAMEYIIEQKNPTVFAEEAIKRLKEKRVYGKVLSKEDLLNGGEGRKIFEERAEVIERAEPQLEVEVERKEATEEEIFEKAEEEEIPEIEMHDIEEVLPEEELEKIEEEKGEKGATEEEKGKEEKSFGEYGGAHRYKEREEYPGELKVFKIEEEELYSKGDMESFVEYFRDRYRKLREILLKRLQRIPEKSLLVSIEDLSRRREEEVTIIGIVTSVRAFQNSFSLEVQDESGFITVRVPKESEKTFFFVGDVVAFRGVYNGRAFRVRENKRGVIFPGFSLRRRKERQEIPPLKIAVTSDVHVGSKNFMKEEFEKFISWINKSEEANSIKYLIIPGDLVDGVGIYPGQEKELEEVDVYKQYEIFFEYISQIDESIYVLITPGNHDLVRQSLPQPELRLRDFKDVVPENVISLQNPAFLRFFDDFNVLLLHGRPLEDLFSKVPGAKHENPTEVMKVILERRHLCPVYGEKTPIQPLPKDHLVITEERCPDLFVTGHVHTFEYSYYKRACLVNASAWQRQTEYQRTRGIVPNPAKVLLFDLEEFYKPKGRDPVSVYSFAGERNEI